VNEEELIRTLARDSVPAAPMLRIERQLALTLLCAATVVVVFTKMGTALSGNLPVLPILACLAMLVASAVGAVVSSVPGRTAWRPAVVLVVISLVVWIVDIIVRAASPEQATRNLWGDASWMKCLSFTTGVSFVAAFVLVIVIRRGWPLRPRVTAALTFVAGASAAALTTTLECPSNAPLHVLVGHIVPIAVVTSVGAALAGRIFSRSASLYAGNLSR
jgi:hypothetical protein